MIISSQSLCYSKDSSFKYISSIIQKNDSVSAIYKKCLKLYNNKKYREALKESLSLVQQIEKTDNNILLGKTNFLIANIFGKINNHQKSILFYKKNLLLNYTNDLSKIKEIKRLNDNYAPTLLNIGSQYQYLGKSDSAKYYYKKLILLPELNTKQSSIIATAYSNLSGILFREKKIEKAKEYALKAIKIHRNNNNKVNEASALNNLANIYLIEKNYEKAKEFYFKGVNLIEKNSSSNAFKFKEDLYFNLAWTLYKLKDYKAYDYQEKSYAIKDDLRDKEIRRMIEEVYAQQKVNLEKEKTNLVTEQRKLLEAEQNKTNLYLGALALLVIIISTTIVYNYRLRQNNLKLKLSETNLLQQQNIEKLKSEAQIKILNATIDGKEAERKEIAETLHDNVSALLSSANMHLSATKKQFSQNTPVEIEKTQSIILEASQKVRDLSHNLVSSILLKFGLEYAIKDVSKKYSNSELTFHTSANNINRYNQEFEIKIFNVVQELINNILKHSKAKNAYINLKEKNNQLTILVKDDGVGFNTSSSSLKDGGIGLNQIEARIHMLNGNFSINSKENSGTTILIKVPVSHKNKKSSKLTSVS
ncbi:tetratricopeptide repeat-containing sensor histidine kinase [Tenacibaculum holothuriorum]|uniref:tetratricopeptide repeat-containing sensor histidine kinase n=1 Tax=Tenacibaculum holothuriorum TaxID=1635173 RepID=UPI001302E0B0|nr:tetratricopeptide repeat protein [Tenacibaculum holothuriorum]